MFHKGRVKGEPRFAVLGEAKEMRKQVGFCWWRIQTWGTQKVRCPDASYVVDPNKIAIDLDETQDNSGYNPVEGPQTQAP